VIELLGPHAHGAASRAEPSLRVFSRTIESLTLARCSVPYEDNGPAAERGTARRGPVSDPRKDQHRRREASINREVTPVRHGIAQFRAAR